MDFKELLIFVVIGFLTAVETKPTPEKQVSVIIQEIQEGVRALRSAEITNPDNEHLISDETNVDDRTKFGSYDDGEDYEEVAEEASDNISRSL